VSGYLSPDLNSRVFWTLTGQLLTGVGSLGQMRFEATLLGRTKAAAGLGSTLTSPRRCEAIFDHLIWATDVAQINHNRLSHFFFLSRFMLRARNDRRLRCSPGYLLILARHVFFDCKVFSVLASLCRVRGELCFRQSLAFREL
jgi:hypothetical protein